MKPNPLNIDVPRLDTPSTHALMRDTLAVAEAEHESGAHVDGLRHADKVLGAVLADAVVPTTPLPNARAPQQRNDRVWAAFERWLDAWRSLDTLPQAELASRVHDKLFSDGLRFLAEPWRVQWAEGEARLGALVTEQLEASITDLGGKPILEAVRDSHFELGNSLGLMSALPQPEPRKRIAEGRQQALEALRFYLVRVQASAVPGDEAAQARALRLLAPFERARQSAPQPKKPTPA